MAAIQTSYARRTSGGGITLEENGVGIIIHQKKSKLNYYRFWKAGPTFQNGELVLIARWRKPKTLLRSLSRDWSGHTKYISKYHLRAMRSRICPVLGENDFGAVLMHTSAKSDDTLYDARRNGARIVTNLRAVTRKPIKLESRQMNPSLASRINRTSPDRESSICAETPYSFCFSSRKSCSTN